MQAIIDKDVQAVTESFNAVIKELNRVNDDIKQVIADLAMEGKLDKVTESTASATVLTNFTQEVANLSTRWNKGIFGKSKPVKRVVTGNSNSSSTKATRTNLRVIFPNNKEIFNTLASKTFVETLRLLKLEDVAKLGKMINGHSLVSKTNSHPDNSNIHKCGDWYVDTRSNTIDKKKRLDEISEELKIPIRVEIV